ncbi:MAG: hypothetical protein FRX49_00840 [Trebouxia sp. A1-2]|nr:MAG: hypothetical protein FRX49_00840 [Trebouxia sp. A1-2]
MTEPAVRRRLKSARTRDKYWADPGLELYTWGRTQSAPTKATAVGPSAAFCGKPMRTYWQQKDASRMHALTKEAPAPEALVGGGGQKHGLSVVLTSLWPYGGTDLRADTARSSPFCKEASPPASSPSFSLEMCASCRRTDTVNAHRIWIIMAPLLGRISVMEAARLMSNSTYISHDHAPQTEQHESSSELDNPDAVPVGNGRLLCTTNT